MENEYSVITACSLDGGDIEIEINYEFATEDELTFVAMNQNGVCEKVTPTSWNGNTATIENPFDCKVWNVVVFRWSNLNESLELRQTDDGDLTTSSIVGQFNLMAEVAKEQQKALKKTLLLADIDNQYLSDKTTRKGKVLSFDDDGNPVCATSLEALKTNKTEAVEAMELAVGAKEDAIYAMNLAVSAKEASLKVKTSVESIKSDIDKIKKSVTTSESNALTYSSNASTSEANAKTYMQTAQKVATDLEDGKFLLPSVMLQVYNENGTSYGVATLKAV